MAQQITSPVLPFMGRLPTEMQPGCRIRIRGVISRPSGDCRIHLQSGDSLDPMDDVALHLNLRPTTREILRNSCTAGQWGHEERAANSPINFDDDFDLVIGADSGGYNIEIDGHQFTSFNHRLAVQSVRFIFITGGCAIRAVLFENWNVNVPNTISVHPSAPVLGQTPSSPSIPVPFQLPSWPHGNFQHFGMPQTPVYPQVPYLAYNPAMLMQQPLIMTFPNESPKNSDKGSNMQYNIVITVLWNL
ncbi:galectin-7-like isoform X2 [Armigeres subalbatus]|uniref:galectin-7-like isoform X2 n=1 Tax=Armigeres subalbatus TaxID=124917 RepID=UPI002ED34F97